MYKLFISITLFLTIIFSGSIQAQGSNSIQINGGMIFHKSSSTGMSGAIQFNYPINNNINLYLYSGYSSWDKYNVIFTEDWSELQRETLFKTYNADGHIMIPLYAGTKLNLHTNKLFTAYVNFEIGYSYLQYNYYKNKKVIDPGTGVVLSYYADENTKSKIHENLFGVGIGAGIFRPITNNIIIILSYRINGHTDFRNIGLFSYTGTYSTLLAGLSFSI